MGRNREGNSWRYLLATAAIALTAACSGNDSITNSDVIQPDTVPLFAAGIPANGTGQCLLDDVIDAGFINSADVNCTSEDVDIAVANVSTYSVNGGPFVTPASTGGKILCSTGDILAVNVSAQVQNHAQERYDVGLWIGTQGTNALTGLGGNGQCDHYNLVNNQNNSVNIDGDQCGDVQANVNVDVPLGTLTGLACVDGDPDPDVVALTISACAGWQNHVDGAARVCPGTPGVPGGAQGSFRFGTTPENPAKCKCEPLSLPLEIRGTITIIKNTVGGDGTFAFTHNVGASSNPTVPTPFNITTASNTGQQVFANVLAGTYTVAESGPPAGWQFTSLVCTAGGVVSAQTATITLPAGGSVTCTYTNTKQGTITIVKNTVGGNGTFAFTHTVGTASDPDVPSPFNITTVANTGQQQFLNVPPGTYTVTESGPPAGWQFTSLSCTTGGSNAGQVATIILPAGGNVTCTYTNTKQGTITIIKNTVGGNGTFAFTHTVGTASDPDVPSPFNITTVANTGQQQFLNVSPGTYTVTETGPPAGWQFSSLSCTAGGSNAGQVATIILPAGGSVTCTFTNSAQGTITIIKNTVGGNGTFAFTHDVGTASDPDVPSPFNITTVSNTGQQAFLNVPAGTYTVTETGPPTGWQFTSLSCTAGGSNAGQVATIVLPAGGSVTCTYTNTKQGTITIIKNTLGGNGTFEFTHTVADASDPDVPSPFSITTVANTGQQQFLNVSPGTYTVTESGPPLGWHFSNLSCTAGGSNAGQVATIILPAGGSVTCTYLNIELGTIIIAKEIIGGGGETFTFTRRISPTNLLDAGDNPNPILAHLGSLSSGKKLLPGLYVVCETNLPAGWFDPTAAGYTLVHDGLGNFCAIIALAAGETKTITFVNQRPPEGGTRTIGFWKNWSSCTKGNQTPLLDTHLGAGSSIYPIGDITTLTCIQAWNLLSKNAIGGQKRAGDPVYNMVAQLLGAKLNLAAGAGTCGALTTALAAAQTFLDNLNFLGTASYGNLSDADKALVNGWAAIFGSYNEGTLGGGCPTHV